MKNKNKLICYNLMLEVTRRCNLQCEHCMRGEAQNIDMPTKILKKALTQFDEIFYFKNKMSAVKNGKSRSKNIFTLLRGMKIGRFSAFTTYVSSEGWNVSVRFSNERIDDFTDKLKKRCSAVLRIFGPAF